MKIKYLALFLLFPISVFAQVYVIEIQTQFNREAPEVARLIVKAGDAIEYSSDKLALKLSPTVVDHNIVKVQTEISHKSPKGLKVVAKPNIVSYLDHPAEFFQESHDGRSDVRLTVVARKME